MSQYFDYRDGKEIEWIELNLLTTQAPISKSLLVSLAPGATEAEIESWIGELRNRGQFYRQPFYQIVGNRIIAIKSWQEIPEYFLCVYYSYRGAGDGSNGTKLFENISAQALRNFLKGNVYTLGFPEGKGLNASLDDIANACYESRGIKANGDYKDDRVDVVGFKLFDDNRPSNLYILLQCAAGQNWKLKSKIELNRWIQYILWYQDNIILSLSTVDFVKKRDWDKRASNCGMLLDRIRIYNTLYENQVDQSLRDEVLEWCNTKWEGNS